MSEELPQNTGRATGPASDMQELVSLCKRRGFILPSSVVSTGVDARWDYGPLGVELKRNIKELWWRAMTDREDIEGIESGQGIPLHFLDVQQSMRQKIPFGIAQVGKATREFEQMEMQFFVRPGTGTDWFEKWKHIRMQWHLDNGIRPHKLRFHEHGQGELAHHAKTALDIEYEFPFAWQGLEAIHDRTDFDLKLEYFDETTKERYIPFIVETSADCDRTLLAALVDAYRFDGDRTWLALHPNLAPCKVAIFPLMKKAELNECSDRIFHDVKKRFRATTDDVGSIGKRYRRQDEIGTPFGVTIDYDTLSNNTVKVRHRDSMIQEKIPADNLVRYLDDKIHNWGR